MIRSLFLPFARLACVPFLFLALSLVLLAGGFDWLSKVCSWLSDYITDSVEDVTQ